METKLLFPTPVWVEDDCGVDLERIQKWVKIVKETDPNGRVASNDGGWQSQDFIPPYIKQDHALTELYEKILEISYKAADEWGFQHYILEVSNLWMNVNTRGNYNHVHTHAGSVLSGVFYAKVPTCCSGDLKFLRDFKDQNLKEGWGCDPNFDRWEHLNETEHYHSPKENQLIVFPSWLPHSVDRSSSEDERISLSFNLHVFSKIYQDNEVYPSKRSTNTNVPLKVI